MPPSESWTLTPTPLRQALNKKLTDYPEKKFTLIVLPSCTFVSFVVKIS